MADDDLPIDIHSGKLLDWLVSRRHCHRDWQKRALELREKLKHAILDMPENEAVVHILQASYINYFHVQQILGILKETEKDTKNFLGYYSSQRMKDWQEIETLYRKENVYLAEAAQILQRLVQYELPAVKKAIAKADSAIQDDTRKEKEYTRQAADANKAYQKELTRLGVEGKKMRADLLSLAADLPAFFEEIAKKIAELKPALDYYTNFRAYLLGVKAEPAAGPLLPLLSLLAEKGSSATVFEWKHGRVPSRVEAVSLHLLLCQDNKEEEGSDEIDFGDTEIDFGDGEIDFGEGEEAAIDIDVVADEQGLVSEEDVARGEEAQGLLENEHSRRALLLQLGQLAAFLSTRSADEQTEAAADIFILGSEQRPAEIRSIGVSQLSDWLGRISSIQTSLSDPHKQNLFKIRSSPQYVETLCADLAMKRDQEGRYTQMAQLMAEKQLTGAEAATQLRAQLAKLIDNTKQLKSQIEGEVSSKYSGRPVHIMGGIAAALQTV